MIKNERQYRITKAQAEKFEQSLAQLSRQPATDNAVHPLLQKAQVDALRSQLADLCAELEEYEALQSGKQTVLHLESFDELPCALIRARIAAGLSQKDLAERLGLKEQQIQRYEATEYASASLDRVKEVIQALGLRVRKDIFLPTADISPSVFFKRLAEIGLDRTFILKRLLPQPLAARLQTGANGEGLDQAVLQSATLIGRIYDVSPAAIFGPLSLQLSSRVAGAGRFKVGAQANERRLSAYTIYAHHLALLLLEATVELPSKPVPVDAQEIRQVILHKYGTLSFEHALRYVWSLGIPVLPLHDSGAFHGAFWRVSGRNVIVLKQQTKSFARWLFDLLHELRHAGQEPEKSELSIIEESETSPERRESEEEQVASQLAGDVMLDGRAEELAHKCAGAAGGYIPRLKTIVPRIAAQENIPVDALANYMAFRLSLEGNNWWGAASNLQILGPDPWQTARDLLLEHVDFGRLNVADRILLQQALSDEEV